MKLEVMMYDEFSVCRRVDIQLYSVTPQCLVIHTQAECLK
jgi:hypothetical protein